MDKTIGNRSTQEEETSERVDGPTPAGGAYSVAYFSDKGGKPCGKSSASRIDIVEFDRRGNELLRTMATTGH
jgi:hypothetical protein